MRFLSSVAASGLLAASLVSTAFAAPLTEPGALRDATASSLPIEKTQFLFGGHSYCWYAVGWRGPGW